MEESNLACSAGDSGDAAVHRHWRRNSHATVELAASTPLRLAPDYFLAGGWDSGVVPDPVRRNWAPRFSPLQFPPSHGRAVVAHDPGGAGTFPARHARTLRLWPIRQPEPGAMKLLWTDFASAEPDGIVVGDACVYTVHPRSRGACGREPRSRDCLGR